MCNEERFGKIVTQGLKEIRNGTHDGLFTANYPGEENWAIAHRILVPAFGPLMIRGMFDGKRSKMRRGRGKKRQTSLPNIKG